MSSGCGRDRRSPRRGSECSRITNCSSSSEGEESGSEQPPKKRRSRAGAAVDLSNRSRSNAQVQSQVQPVAPHTTSELSAGTSTHRTLNLLDLPAEVRHGIYELLLIQPDKSVWFHQNHTTQFASLGLHVQILRTCRQIKREGSSVLYALQTFYFRSVRQAVSFTKALPPSNAVQIRKIFIEVMTNEWVARLDDMIWPPHNPGELHPESVFGFFPYLSENTSLNLHFKTHHPQRPTNVDSGTDEDEATSSQSHLTWLLRKCQHDLLMIHLYLFQSGVVWERWMGKELWDRNEWQEWQEWNVLSKGLTMSNIVTIVLEEQRTDFLSCTLQIRSLNHSAKTAEH